MLEALLYPARCVACEYPGEWLCATCIKGIELYPQSLRTPVLPSGRPSTIHRLFAVASYAHSPWSKLITSIKYDGLEEVQTILSPLLQTYRDQNLQWPFSDGEGWTLIPVPTNPDHLEERGYDHLQTWMKVWQTILPNASLAANVLCRRSGRGAHAALHIPGAREAAMQDGVAVIGPVPKKVLLLDDVYTTGATLQGCAEKLKEAGAQEIEAIVAAASF